MENDRQKTRRAALRLLSGRDHTITELKNKLMARNFGEASIESAVSDCVGSGYVDDNAFAVRFVRDQLRKGYGRLRIRNAMNRKGFASNVIDAALREHLTDAIEQRKIQELSAKHKQSSRPLPNTIKEKQRLFRFLQNRGFAGDTIRAALNVSVHANDAEP